RDRVRGRGRGRPSDRLGWRRCWGRSWGVLSGSGAGGGDGFGVGSGIRAPAVGPAAGPVVEADGLAVLSGALVPAGVVLVLGVDSAVGAVPGLGGHDLRRELVARGVGACA